MFGVLFLGLLIGLQHAVEADHLAAMASLGTRAGSVRDAARQGALWGLGHSLTLLAVGGAFLLLDGMVPERLAIALEAIVGAMLVLLGGEVLLRAWRKRVHFHAHRHGAKRHFHAHSHAAGGEHAEDPHNHQHPQHLRWRSLAVGMMHGMAGSAALVVLALGSVDSIARGLAYIAIFGLGSVLGMALLGAAISLPLRWSAHSLTWAHQGLTLGVGVFTLGLGAVIVIQSGLMIRAMV